MKRLVLALLILTFLVGSGQAVSVDVGGWKFTTDLEGWVAADDFSVESYDANSPDWEHPCETNSVVGSWKGDVGGLLIYPAFPNAPKDNDMYGRFSGKVWIYVVKIPEDLKKAIEERDLAVYGSLDKVPDDRKEENQNKILRDATRIPIMCIEYDSDKAIEFNDKKAYLSEEDGDRQSTGVIAFLLDNNTVGVLDVDVDRDSKWTDGAVPGGRAWDVIESFTANKA